MYRIDCEVGETRAERRHGGKNDRCSFLSGILLPAEKRIDLCDGLHRADCHCLLRGGFPRGARWSSGQGADCRQRKHRQECEERDRSEHWKPQGPHGRRRHRHSRRRRAGGAGGHLPSEPGNDRKAPCLPRRNDI